MRVRNRKMLPYKNVMIVLFALLPLGYIGYLGVKTGDYWERMTVLNYEVEPDPSTFLPANYSRLAEMAEVYDYRYEKYHIPLNLSVATMYVDLNYTDVDYYIYSDNCALWTGLAISGWVGKYMAAIRENDTAMLENATRVLRKLIHGFSMLVTVPNGGLGPGFPGILARGYARPGDEQLAPYLFAPSTRHFNGSGAYSQWRWRGFTSNDEYGGFYMGLALALKYVDDPYVQTTVRLIVEQVVDYNLKNNFLGINGPGSLTGVTQKPRFGSAGFWAPIQLKMASMVNPEKYERLYYRWVMEEMALTQNVEGGDNEIVANYYAYNFAHCTVFGYLMLEDPDTAIARKYYDGYIKSLRKFTANHRNAYFNSIYLAVIERYGIDDPNQAIVRKDVEDQLMRVDINHFPDVRAPLVEVPADWPNATHLGQIAEDLANDGYSSFYNLTFVDVDLEKNHFYKRPLTIEMRPTCIFPWEKNPYKYEYRGVNLLYEEAGQIFTVPYWILRGFVGIPSEGM